MAKQEGSFKAVVFLIVITLDGAVADTEQTFDLRNYQTVTVPEVESYCQLMLHRFDHSLEKFRDYRFPGYACSSAEYQLNATVRSLHGVEEVCEQAFAEMFIPQCVLMKAFKDHLSHCGKALRQDIESLDSIYCLVALTTMELFWKVIMEIFDFKACKRWSRMSTVDMLNWCYNSTADAHPHFFLMGREFVDRYQLKKQPSVRNICDLYAQNNFNPRGHPQLAYIPRLLTSASLRFHPEGHKLPNVSEMCWEPTLQYPNLLYHKPGRWNVSEECVTLLQSLAATMYRNMTRRYNAYMRVHRKLQVEEILRTYPENSRFRLWYPALCRYWNEIRAVAFDAEDPVNQLWLYPIFKRFAQTARQRRSSVNMTSPVVVSCAGLQGMREEVVPSVIQLLRLVIVNDMHVAPYFHLYHASIIRFNHFLPCLAEEAI